MSTSADKPEKHLGLKIVVGIIGAVLSLALHELFHIIMHWGHVTGVSFFPNLWTVVQLHIDLPSGYDLSGEETVAYMITFAVIMITVIIIFGIHDSADERTSAQMLFPKDKDFQDMNVDELLKLSELDDPLYPLPAPKSVTGNHKPKR